MFHSADKPWHFVSSTPQRLSQILLELDSRILVCHCLGAKGASSASGLAGLARPAQATTASVKEAVVGLVAYMKARHTKGVSFEGCNASRWSRKSWPGGNYSLSVLVVFLRSSCRDSFSASSRFVRIRCPVLNVCASVPLSSNKCGVGGAPPYNGGWAVCWAIPQA